MQLLKRLRDLVSLGEPVEYDYDPGQHQTPTPQPPPAHDYREPPRRRERERPPIATPVESSTPRNAMNNNVIGLPTAHPGPFEVMVMEPRSFEEMPQAIQALRERKSVVLNVTLMEPDLAQRAVDFVAGGTYAIDGHQERLGESIFLFTPNGVQVSTRTSAPNVAPVDSPNNVLRNTPPIWTPEAMPAYLAQ